MASNSIVLKGTTYNGVSSLEVPLSGGGNALFTDVSDTTAAAADVASGKYFYTAAGAYTQGTASGGGGATNCVCGTFTTGSTGGVAETVTIPYTGNGYPVSTSICISEGYSNSSGTAYNTLHRYAVIALFVLKYNDLTPSYSLGDNDLARVFVSYKNSDTTASTTSTTSGETKPYRSGDATSASAINIIRINSATQLSLYVSSNSYGLLPNTEYTYCIGYSS